MQLYTYTHRLIFPRKINLYGTIRLFSTDSKSFFKFLTASKRLLDHTTSLKDTKLTFLDTRQHEILKNEIKESTSDIQSTIDSFTTNELYALLLTYIQIFERCRISGDFYKLLINEIITKIEDADPQCNDINTKTFIKNDIGHLIPLLKNIHINETYLIHLLCALRHFDIGLEFSPQMWDFVLKRISKSISKFSILQLQEITDHLSALVIRKSWLFSGPILLRVILAMMERIEQTNQSLNMYNILNILKALSKGNIDPSSEILTKLLKYTESLIDISLENPYKWTKLKIHLLQTLLLCNFATPILTEKLIEHIRLFCSSCGSINAKHLEDSNEYINQYNTAENINPGNMLYPKYPNYIVPGGLKKQDKESHTTFLYLAGLERLQDIGKITFCRSIKTIQMLINMEHSYMISSFSPQTLSFLEQVNKFELKTFPRPNKYVNELEGILKLKFINKAIGPFEIYCLNNNNSLVYLEPVINRQLVRNKHCKMLEIKLKYLKSMGWNPKLLYESEWKKLSSSEKERYAQNLWGESKFE